MARILVIEDDPGVQRVVQSVLRTEGHDVTAVGDGNDGLALAQSLSFDLFVLDVTLPTLSGLDIAMRLRETCQIPILMLTGKDSESDVLTGLALGADDYVTKPFSPAILAARVRNVLRRGRHGHQAPAPGPAQETAGPDDEVLTCGALILNLDQWTASLAGELINLTAREFKLLCFLLRHQNRVITRDGMLNRVWGEDFDGSDRVVDVSLSRLRRHLLDRENCPLTVQAIPGVGYKVVLKTSAPDVQPAQADQRAL